MGEPGPAQPEAGGDPFEEFLDGNDKMLAQMEYDRYLAHAEETLKALFDANECPREKDLKGYHFIEVLTTSAQPIEQFFEVRREESSETLELLMRSRVAALSFRVHDYLIVEKKLLYAHDCPFIRKARYVFQDSLHLYLMVDNAFHGTLGDCLVPIQNHRSEELTKLIAAQIILAIEYLHSCGYIHRALSKDNICVFEDGYLKLSDLKTVRRSSQGFDRRVPSYTYPPPIEERNKPPELRNITTIAGFHSYEVDWWFLGSIVNEIVLGVAASERLDHPVDPLDDNTATEFRATEFLKESFPIFKLDDDMKDFMTLILRVDAGRRLGSQTAGPIGGGRAREHAWLKDIDFIQVHRKMIPMRERLPQLTQREPQRATTGSRVKFHSDLLSVPPISVFDDY